MADKDAFRPYYVLANEQYARGSAAHDRMDRHCDTTTITQYVVEETCAKCVFTVIGALDDALKDQQPSRRFTEALLRSERQLSYLLSNEHAQRLIHHSPALVCDQLAAELVPLCVPAAEDRVIQFISQIQQDLSRQEFK